MMECPDCCEALRNGFHNGDYHCPECEHQFHLEDDGTLRTTQYREPETGRAIEYLIEDDNVPRNTMVGTYTTTFEQMLRAYYIPAVRTRLQQGGAFGDVLHLPVDVGEHGYRTVNVTEDHARHNFHFRDWNGNEATVTREEILTS